jgi:hypothetical protein
VALQAYAAKTGQLYKLSIGQITINPINAIDSTVSGTITSMSSKRNGNASTITLTNVSFKACLKTYIPTITSSFTMSTLDGNTSANWSAVKIKAHLGENPRDIGRLVVEAEDAASPKKRFVVQLPINAVSNTATAAYLFPDNSSVYSVEDVYATYNKGSGADYTSQLNGTAGAPQRLSQLGVITHNKENRTIVIDNMVLSLDDGSNNIIDYKVFKGKLNVRY